MKIKHNISYTQEELDSAFPEVDPGFEPLGSRIIVQLRSARTVSKGGVILPDDAKDTEKWNTQVAKVRAIGPVAFRSRDTLDQWPEGAWLQAGDYVRIPKYNQDKWEVEAETGETNAMGHSITSNVLFMLINDLDVLAKVTSDPLKIKAYI